MTRKPTWRELLAEIFIWWHGQTLGTRIVAALRFTEVGQDEQGNTYHQEKNGPRRWVLYNGPAESTRIPPGWYAWMHHRTDIIPTSTGYTPRSWEKPHQPNLTGTPFAYRPDGSLLRTGQRPRVSGDYQAWSPDEP
jgi:NADH:ubiquinone oxidoreductase subunit